MRRQDTSWHRVRRDMDIIIGKTAVIRSGIIITESCHHHREDNCHQICHHQNSADALPQVSADELPQVSPPVSRDPPRGVGRVPGYHVATEGRRPSLCQPVRLANGGRASEKRRTREMETEMECEKKGRKQERETAGTLPKVPAGLFGCHPVSLGHLPALSRRPPAHTTQKHREEEPRM